MPEYFRIKVGDNGKTFVVDEEGNKIPPERHREIAAQIIETVDEDAFVYVGYSSKKMLYKIGVTNNVERREKELSINIFLTITCEAWGDYSAFTLEKILHRIFTQLGQHIEGEWFELDGIDLFFLTKVYNDVKRGHIKEEFAAILELERIVEAVWDDPSFVSPYGLITRLSHPSQWKSLGIYGLYRVKALAHYYASTVGDKFAALMIYQSVICVGYKSVFKEVFKNHETLVNTLLEGDYVSVVEDFEHLLYGKEKGAE